MPRVVLIADAGPSSGLGHLARSSALGAALLTRSAKVNAFGLDLGKPVERYGIRWIGGTDDDYGAPSAIVLDSYSAGQQFRAALRAIAPLVVFGDGTSSKDDADLAISASVSERSGWLSGPKYACLGPPYWAITPKEPRLNVRRVLVATGGGDVADVGSELAASVRDALPGVGVALVRGPFAVQNVPEGVELVSAPPSLDAEIQDSDLVVCSAGQTLLEVLAAGVPAVSIAVVENQRRQLAALKDAGAVVAVSTPTAAVEAVSGLAVDLESRRRLSAAARAAVDGQGALRVADEVLALGERSGRNRHINLRQATADDASALLRWRNDGVTRKFSFTKHEISEKEHRAWLAERLSDPDTLLWIGTRDETPVGQVRLTRDGRGAEIHITVAPEARGHGYGAAMIQRAITTARQQWPELTKVIARIDPRNLASARSFESAGFTPDPQIADEFVLHVAPPASAA